MEETRDMTNGKPFSLIISFALPLLISNVFQQLYNMADSMVVGRLIGVEAFAAVGAAGFLSWTVISIILGFTQGFGVLFAQYFGAKDIKGLRKAVAMSVKISIICGIALTVLDIAFAEKILILIQTPADILGDTLKYIIWIFAGTIITLAYNLAATILRSLGNSRTPLIAVVISSIINIVLDIAFVAAFGMGVEGVALATVIAQLCSFLYCLYKLSAVRELRLSRQDFATDRKMINRLLGLGFPLAFRDLVISSGGLIIQYAINGFGTLYIAGISASKKYFGLMELIGGAVEGAIVTFVSQNYGAGNLNRIREGMRSAVKLAVISSCLILVFMVLSGRFLVGLLIASDPMQMHSITEIGYHSILVMAACLPALYLLYVYRSALQGMGNTLIPMISGFIEFILRLLSVLILPSMINAWGLYLSDGLGWIGAAVLLIISYYHVFHKKIKKAHSGF